MSTVIFYNFILFGSTFFVWVSEKGKGNLERYFFLGIAFLIVFVPAAIRYDIGTDYLNYVRIFESDWEFASYKFKEPMFYLINLFYKTIGAHYQWIFATFAFIFTFVAFIAYPKKNAWLLHFLFFSILLFSSFNIMRQAVALAWCLLAIIVFFDKRYLWFLFLTVIGAMFHQSVVLIAIVGLLSLIPLSDYLKTRVAPLIFISFIVLAFLYMNVVLLYIEQILNFIGLKRYAGYFYNVKQFVDRDYGTGLGVLVNLIFSIYIILNTKLFVRENKSYWVLIVMTFFYAVGLVLANNIVIFDRMVNTFMLAPILGAYLLFQLGARKKIHRIVLLLFLLFLVLSFIKNGMGIETSRGDPKRNPYKSILMN